MIVLVLLYFAFILRDWHYIEDVRAMVVPFVTFGLFAGTLLSIMPMTRLAPRPWRSTCVFVVATCIPVGALIVHLNLIATLGFAPVATHPEYKTISQAFYRGFALCTIGFFGATALCGYYAARAINESLAIRLHLDTLEKKARHQLVTSSVTALIGIAGAIVTALVGGSGGH